MGVKDDLIAAGIHPNALRCVSNEAVYVSAGRREYRIKQDGPYWSIKAWPWGPLRKSLKGSFTSFKLCEDRLVSFLRATDRRGRAIYPNKESNGKS